MKFFLGIFNLLIIGAVCAAVTVKKNNDEPTVVNEFLDEKLKSIDNKDDVSPSLNISKVAFGKYTFNHGVLKNLKTFKRKGDATMWSVDRKVSVAGDLVLKKMIFKADSLVISDGDKKKNIDSPVLQINENLLHFLFQVELDTKSGCTIKAQIIYWKKLEGTISSKNKEYDNTDFNLSDDQLKQLNLVSSNNKDLLNFLRDNMIVCNELELDAKDEAPLYE